MSNRVKFWAAVTLTGCVGIGLGYRLTRVPDGSTENHAVAGRTARNGPLPPVIAPSREQVTGSGGKNGGPGDDAVGGYGDQVAELLRAGEFARADAVIDAWSAAEPDDERATLARAELRAAQGRRSEAIGLFTSVVDRAAEPARIWLRVADLYEAMGQYESAIASCREATVADPAATDAGVRLGDLLRIVGQLDDAADVLEPLWSRDPSSRAVRHALAAVRNGQGRSADVVTLLEPFKDDPELPANARQHYAVALDELRRWAEAAEVWADLLERDPYLVEGYYRLGRLARRLERRELAEALLATHERLAGYTERLEAARKAELGGQTARALSERAAAYADTNQISRALETYAIAVDRSPDAVDISIAAVLFCLRADLLAEANGMIARMRDRPDLPRHLVYAMAGLVAEREGRVADAAVAYDAALQTKADYRPVLVARATIHLNNRDAAAAATLIARAHGLNADAESYGLQGRLALLTNDPIEARRLFGQSASAAKRRSEQADAWMRLGQALVAEGKATDAIPWLERATTASPWLAQAWESLVEACEQSGRSAQADDARVKLADAEQVETEIASIRKALGTGTAVERSHYYVRLAEIARTKGESSRTERYLAAAVHANPADADALRRRAASFEQPGDVFFRIRLLRQLEALQPGAVDVHRRLAESHIQIGLRADRAVRHARTVLALAADAGAHALLARALLSAGRATDALPHAQRAAKLNADRYAELPDTVRNAN